MILKNVTETRITRVINACVLIQIGGHNILTDPFFINPSKIGIKESVAIQPEELPPLTAIIGCHDFIDHWQMAGLAKYLHNKDDVKILVPMKSMLRKAKKVGFNNGGILRWGAQCVVADGLTIESVRAQKMGIWTVNNYVLRSNNTVIFFGSEARDISPLKEYREKYGVVDIALLPTNAVHLFGFYKIVMSGKDAVNATQVLGAKKLVVIHDAHPTIPGLIHIKSSGDEAEATASNLEKPTVEVVRIPTGKEWTYDLKDWSLQQLAL